MYTGDLRGHGRKKRLFEAMLGDPPAGMDVLLMEGTHVTAPERRPSSDPSPGVARRPNSRPTWWRRSGRAGCRSCVSSAQNIDRLVTVYRAARRANRTLLVDLYTATVAAAIGRATIPQPGFPQLGVYVPQSATGRGRDEPAVPPHPGGPFGARLPRAGAATPTGT